MIIVIDVFGFLHDLMDRNHFTEFLLGIVFDIFIERVVECKYMVD